MFRRRGVETVPPAAVFVRCGLRTPSKPRNRNCLLRPPRIYPSRRDAECRCVRSCRLLLSEVLRQPAEHRLMPAFAVDRSDVPMSFIRKHQRLRCDAVAAKRGEKLKSLIDGNPEILLIC